nr:reverse transcriptase domain-containing protein [Tanacetum cinerariifolium]
MYRSWVSASSAWSSLPTPLPPIDSPIAESLGYVAELDPEEDPEEYEDDETEDGLVDYPMDEGDNRDDDDGDSSGDDADDEDEDEEEEHLAPTDSAIVIPTVKLVSPPEGTKPVIPPPSTDTTTTGARINVRLQDAISLPPEAEVERLLAMPTPPPSPLTSLSSPSAGEHLARDDIPETEMPPRKRLCLSTLGSRYESGKSSTARPTREVGYGIRDTWVDPVEAVPEIAPMTEGEVNTKWVDLLMEDRTAHQETILIVEEEAYAAREAWAHSIGLSQAVKFATCTLLDAALTWWNSQIRSLGPDAYSMTWEVLQKKMTDKYCPQGEIKKLEIELWNLKVKGNDVPAYTEQRQTNNKIKADDSFRNNHGHQQQPAKIQNVAKIYNMGSGERKPCRGNLPKCTKCHLHHNGLCTQKCHKCNNVGHFAHDCRSSGNTIVANAQRDNRENPKGNGCFECGAPWHFKRDCLKLKNKDGGNVNAQGWVYAVGNAEKKRNASRDPDSDVVTGTFLLNNRYASILFDTGADRSFISTAFSSLIDIVPTPLGNSYDVELADGKIVGVDTIMRGYTLNFLNHPFNIDLMPIELGSFDVIIGMDWLRRCHAVIVCDEKLVRVPYGDETLIFRGDESNDGRESRLTIISCSKAQE